ncbi:uncharacterized protein LOC142342855 isoform X2 [Convolutriloba macropyga]|uniref:uncharacterized protein LOC142342855 isoform X2 n=1 Tax=Convolutriloba macropyga TaxID=536237 RepID=UPI003F51B4C2
MDLFACSGEVGQAALVWNEIFQSTKAANTAPPSLKNVSSAPVLTAVHNTMLGHQHQASSNENNAATGGLDQSQSSLNEHDEEENAESSFTGTSAFASDNVLITIGSKSDRSESIISEEFLAHDSLPKTKRVSNKNYSSNNSSCSGSKGINGITTSAGLIPSLVKDDLDLMMKNKAASRRDYRSDREFLNGEMAIRRILEPKNCPGNLDIRLSPGKEKLNFSKTPWIQEGKTYPATVVGLHEEIHDFFNWICPTEAECTMRSEVVKRVQNAVNKVWPAGYVEVYGSYKSGLYLPTSDIDLSIMVSNVSAQDIAKWLSLLEKQLKADNVCSDNGAKVLPHAVVPIIKLTDRITNVRVDISVNIVNASNSAKLVCEFVRKFPPLPHLVLVLKQFLLQRDLNEVYQGGLSSYSLILMVVSFLQLHPRAEGCKSADVNYGVLLIEFFELYGKNMNYLRAGIRVNDGGSYVPRKERQDAPFLSIEDPLDKENDIGKVSWAAQIVKDAFEYAYYTLMRAVTSLTGSTVNSFLSKIIEINEETQDYRHWINDKWKGFVTADEAPPFAPYFTNYDKHYNPYFYTQYDEKCLQMMKLAQQAQQHAAVSNVVGPSPSCPQGIIPFPNLSLLQSGGVLTTHPSTTVVSAPATFTALSTSANGSSVTGGASNNSSSAQSTASDSENSGNGAEQSSSYSYGSNENHHQVPLSIAVSMANSNVMNGVVNKRSSEFHGNYRNRDEKRQAISVANANGGMNSGPNVTSHQHQPAPRYLNNQQGNFPMEGNKQSHQNQERYNRPRHHNWSRRQGGYQQVGPHNNNNSIANLASGGGGGGGGNYGGNRKNNRSHFNRGYMNNSGGHSNYHRSANSPLVVSSAQQQNKLNPSQGPNTQHQGAVSLLPGVLFNGGVDNGDLNTVGNNLSNVVVPQISTAGNGHQLIIQQQSQHPFFNSQQNHHNSRIPPRHQNQYQQHQPHHPVPTSSPSSTLNLTQPLGDYTNNIAMNTYTRKTRGTGGHVTKNDNSESTLSEGANLSEQLQCNSDGPVSGSGNGENLSSTYYTSLPQASGDAALIGANGDLPQSSSSYSNNVNASNNVHPRLADPHDESNGNLGLMPDLSLQSNSNLPPLSLKTGLSNSSSIAGQTVSSSNNAKRNNPPSSFQNFNNTSENNTIISSFSGAEDNPVSQISSSVSVPSNINLGLQRGEQGQQYLTLNSKDSEDRLEAETSTSQENNVMTLSYESSSHDTSLSIQNLFRHQTDSNHQFQSAKKQTPPHNSTPSLNPTSTNLPSNA